jgi:hypothetical protein
MPFPLGRVPVRVKGQFNMPKNHRHRGPLRVLHDLIIPPSPCPLPAGEGDSSRRKVIRIGVRENLSPSTSMTNAALSKTPCDLYGVTVKVNDESLNNLLSPKADSQLLRAYFLP